MGRKKTKLCLVCGNDFLGTNGKMTCSGACRTEMSRMLSAGKKPEYWLIAKGKGQKVPNFFKSVSKERKQPESKKDIAPQEKPIIIKEPQKVTQEELVALETELRDAKAERLPPGMHPRTFKLQQDDKITDLQSKIDQYKKVLVLNLTNNPPQTNFSINTKDNQ